MLSEKDIQKIEEVVNAENAEQMISEIMNRFGLQSAEKANFILNEACSISTFIAQHRETIGKQYKAAASVLVNAKCFADKKERLAYFLKVCIVIFPTGKIETTHTEEESRYLRTLVDLLLQPDYFDWNKKEDWKWARANGFDKYLRLVDGKTT